MSVKTLDIEGVDCKIPHKLERETSAECHGHVRPNPLCIFIF